MKLLFTFALLLAPVCCSAAEIILLDLDPAKTQVDFTVHDPLHTVHGNFQLKKGSIRWDPDSGKASGEIIVDVQSGASGSGVRDRRMHKEILESQRYPVATFKPDRVDGKLAPAGQSQIAVHGVFNIHGADHEMTMYFVVGRSGDQFNVSTRFTIPYVQWGMKDPSNFIIKVGKTVDIEVKTTTAHMMFESV